MAKQGGEAPLRVGIVGMGPVGSTLAAHLLEAGAFVVPCDILREKIDAIKKSGIRLKNTIEKEVRVTDVCYSVGELVSYNLDLVSISVKTPYLGLVLTELFDVAPEDLFVMSAQNGIDNERDVARVFGEDRTLRMVINYAGSMIDVNTVNVGFFHPPNYLAPLAPKGERMAHQIVDLLNAVGLTTRITDAIQDHVWEKAILNSALSPVCAITGMTMQDVMDSSHGIRVVEALLDESMGVAEVVGIRFPEEFRDSCIQYLKGGGPHRPSMLVDIDNGLPTEIDRLNGKIVEYGRKHGVPVPVNLTISRLIRLMEHSPQGGSHE
ncbi:MAG: ketopantoate reductase family protein [Fidelibacterota bacterium]